MMDEREAEYWLNYQGDVRASFDSHQPLGPSYNNEMLWPIEGHYDPDTNMTRIGLSKQMPPGLLPSYGQTTP